MLLTMKVPARIGVWTCVVLRSTRAIDVVARSQAAPSVLRLHFTQ